MPKRRHNDDDADYIKHKIKKLERKLMRSRRHKRRRDKSVSLSPDSSPQRSNIEEPDIIESVISPLQNEVDETTTGPSNLDSNEVQLDVSELLEVTNPATTSSLDSVEEPACEIDGDILEILGEDPTVSQPYGKEIQSDLAIRLKHYATEGLTKEVRKELTLKYLTPINCTLIDPPVLNAEVKAAVTDIIVKRDKAIEAKQKQMAAAISSLSQAITLYISLKSKEPTLLRLLMDTIRILCDSQHTDSMTRKNFVLFALRKEMKTQLQTTKIDKYLFSENLPDVLKSAKAINKSITDLKPTPAPAPKSQMQYKKPGPLNTKNWRAPPQARRQTEAPRTVKAPAQHPAAPRNRSMTSTKPSLQHHRANQYRR